jgi:hypothetical protein
MSTGKLDAQDIRALRDANYAVCFYHRTAGEPGRVRAIREDRSGPFNGSTEREITVPSRIAAYDRETLGDVATLDAYHMEHSPQQSDKWQTIAGLLRPGDVLSLLWWRGNNSPALDAAGYVRDELRIQVQRGKRRLTFMLAVSNGPANSARLVRTPGERIFSAS